MRLETISWRYAPFKVTSLPPVHVLVPIVVRLKVDLHFDGVVCSGHHQHIILDLFPVYFDVQIAHRCKKQRHYDARKEHKQAHLVKFACQLFLTLLARILHEQMIVGRKALFGLQECLSICKVNFEVNGDRFLPNDRLDQRLHRLRIWLTLHEVFIVDAHIRRVLVCLTVHAVVVNFANMTVGALQTDPTHTHRHRLTLN